MADTDFDIDQDLLTKFSCMGTTDRDVLVGDLHIILGSQLSREECAFFLDMTNWNLQAAIGAYYDYFSNSQLPEMALVEDVTIGNGETIPPNTEFTKTWRIKNSGQEAWPSGVYLALGHGDSMCGPSFLSLPPLKAGEVGDISVNLRSPAQPGLFQSQWKMFSPNGSPCGDTIWVIIGVEEGGLLGLTQQMSSITTQDGHMDTSERTSQQAEHENPFASPCASPHSIPLGSSPHSIQPGPSPHPIPLGSSPHSIQPGPSPHPIPLGSSPHSIPLATSIHSLPNGSDITRADVRITERTNQSDLQSTASFMNHSTLEFTDDRMQSS